MANHQSKVAIASSNKVAYTVALNGHRNIVSTVSIVNIVSIVNNVSIVSIVSIVFIVSSV